MNSPSTQTQPAAPAGHFGPYGGRYVAETLMPAVIELEAAWRSIGALPDFARELETLLTDYAGRPTPLFYARRLTEHCGGARIYLKREDLTHTGAHKINNTLGQGLLARWMGKKKVIAETGAGQHGVATATVAALFGMECRIFMGTEDIRRQGPNVRRMELLGARVVPVSSGTGTLKDAMNEALRYWVAAVRDTFYVIGSVAGPHPYPTMVRDFQRVIGDEAETADPGRGRAPAGPARGLRGRRQQRHGPVPSRSSPTTTWPCSAWRPRAWASTPENTPRPSGPAPWACCTGAKSYLLQDGNGQILEAHSISAGLDYPGVGPEHAFLKDTGRARYVSVTDRQALEAFYRPVRAWKASSPPWKAPMPWPRPCRRPRERPATDIVLVNLSGRGDKDLGIVAEHRVEDNR